MSAVERPDLSAIDPVEIAQEYDRVKNEFEALNAEFTTATPERQREIQERLVTVTTRFHKLSAQIVEGTSAGDIKLGDLDDQAEMLFGAPANEILLEMRDEVNILKGKLSRAPEGEHAAVQAELDRALAIYHDQLSAQGMTELDFEADLAFTHSNEQMERLEREAEEILQALTTATDTEKPALEAQLETIRDIQAELAEHAPAVDEAGITFGD